MNQRVAACALWDATRDPGVPGDSPCSRPHWVEATWEIRGGRIWRIDDAASSAGSESPRLWMIPGLVDAHAHLAITRSGVVTCVDQCEQAVRAQASHGVTLIRDCGAPVWFDDFDTVAAGARVIRSGRHIARPRRYIRDIAVEVEDERDLPRVVSEQAVRGDGWVKLVGDWIDRSRGQASTLDPLWSAAALRDAVAAAHDAGARVTVHTFSQQAIPDLLAAGVDGIEHGSGLTPPTIAEIVDRGIAVTPTLIQVALFPQFAAQAGQKYPAYGKQMRDLDARHPETVAAMIDAGVTFLPGTDAGGYQDHGILPLELARWVNAGMDAADVIDAATWKAREFLRQPALHHGAPADFVIYDEDPRSDITVLSRPLCTVVNGRVVWERGADSVEVD